LKAKARHDRWQEEITLLAEEMDWTTQFYIHMANLWLSCAKHVTTKPDTHSEPSGDQQEPRSSASGVNLVSHESTGLHCYARRQSKMWLSMAEEAQATFQNVKQGLGFL
jgi:hypothetical protein